MTACEISLRGYHAAGDERCSLSPANLGVCMNLRQLLLVNDWANIDLWVQTITKA